MVVGMLESNCVETLGRNTLILLYLSEVSFIS